MCDDGIPVIQVKILCTLPKWGPNKGILIWCQDEDGKCMLLDGEPKPYALTHEKWGEKTIKGTFGFIEYYKFRPQS